MNLDMTKGSPLKLILKFLVPVLLGCVFQQLGKVWCELPRSKEKSK